MDSVVHFRHSREEVADLAQAIVPMMDHIKRVGNYRERSAMKAILEVEWFRYGDAQRVRYMLRRAVKQARASLGEYFALLQPDILQQAQDLEDAVNRYWRNFTRLREETLPVH